MFLMPTPRERRVGNISVSSLVCLNTKMTKDFGDYAQGEGFPKDGASPQLRVSAPSDLVLHSSETSYCRMPTLEGNFPRHFLARCLNIRHWGQLFLPEEGACRRNPLTPTQGLDTQILTLYCTYLANGLISAHEYVLPLLALNLTPAPSSGDAYTWRRLILTTLYLGDASSLRRLILATPASGDALSLCLLFLNLYSYTV